jgi:hypothetical protein
MWSSFEFFVTSPFICLFYFLSVIIKEVQLLKYNNQSIVCWCRYKVLLFDCHDQKIYICVILCRCTLGIWEAILHLPHITTSLLPSIITAFRYPRSKLCSWVSQNHSTVSRYVGVMFFFAKLLWYEFFFVSSNYTSLLPQDWNSLLSLNCAHSCW